MVAWGDTFVEDKLDSAILKQAHSQSWTW
jgi:hypothetical protein